MRLVPYRDNPWRMLEDLQTQINRLFDISFGKGLSLGEEIFTPSVDISEDKDNIYVECDLPGLEQKDINLSVKSGSLCISGKKEESKEEKKKNYHRVERFSGSFYREVALPTEVDTSKIKANYKNGVLKILLPKKEEEKEKEIKINVE